MSLVNGLIKLGFTPNVDFVAQNDGEGDYIKDWLSSTAEPSVAEINTASTRLQAEDDANQYQRDRASEYPSIEDQLDDLFHNGIEGWKTSIQAVKDKYPKE